MIFLSVWLIVALLLHTLCWWKLTYYRGDESFRWVVWFAIWFWPLIVSTWVLMVILNYPICILLWPLALDD